VAQLVCQPIDRGDKPIGQLINVEAEASAPLLQLLLFLGEQIQQQGPEPAFLQVGRHRPVAGATPAAAAAVGKDHQRAALAALAHSRPVRPQHTDAGNMDLDALLIHAHVGLGCSIPGQ
jgi:hypothetical protein